MCYLGAETRKIAYLVFDPLPDDSGHFVSVEIYDGLVDLDFLEGSAKASSA